MFINSTILSCFAGLIGFENSYNSDHPPVDSDLLQSASGMYVGNRLHPLLTYDNILAVSEQFEAVNVRVYDSAINYAKGNIVKSGSDVYQSLADANTGNAVSDATKWQKTTLLSAYLRKVYEGSVLKLFNQVFVEKKLNEVAKSLLGNLNMFEGVGNITGRITKSDRLVGFKISVRNKDVVATINQIGLQIDTAQTLNLYLFHSSSNEPLQTFALNHTKSVTFQWHKITNAVMAFMDDNVNVAGSYYLCYYEEDLTGSAIRKDLYWNGFQQACGSCSEAILNNRLYNQRSKYLYVQPFYLNSGYFTKGEMWDEFSEIILYNENWGINFQVSIQCDVSNWLCQNKTVFADALSKQLVYDLLSEMTFSLRDNQKKEKVAAMAAIALDNQEHGQYGEAKKLTKSIQAISFDLSSISPECLPCQDRTIKKSSVWG
jgi:hypothetical protein